NDLHGRLDGCADKLFCHAVAFDDVALPGGGAAAMAAHRRNQEGPGIYFLEILRHCPQNQGDIGNAPAPGRERHALAGPDGALQIQSFESFADGMIDILDPGPFKLLTNANQLGKSHDSAREKTTWWKYQSILFSVMVRDKEGARHPIAANFSL